MRNIKIGEEYQPALEIEKLALNFIRTYAPLAFFGIVISMSVIAVLLYYETQTSTPIYWLACVIFTQIVSYYVRRKLPTSSIPHKRKLAYAIYINIWDGFVIASCIVFMPYVGDIIRTVLIFAMVTGCIGATITTLGYQPFFLAFSIPIMCSFLASSVLSASLWDGSNSLYVVFIISCTICVFVFAVSKGINYNYRNSFLTNLKNIEVNEELKKAVIKAKTANQSKTRFLASASHDLRQPINTLSLFVATLSLRNLNEEDSKIVKHMTTAISTIDTQLTSLLEISKLDSGIIKPTKKRTNIVRLIEGIIQTYGDQKQSHNLNITFISESKSIIVNTDQMLFERIINNLISNAIKYTPKGSVNVSISLIDSEFLKLSIKDSGIGISNDNLVKIYDEFYQANNPAREGSEGFGLGLSIVKRLCGLLNVTIDITSMIGVGTEVKLTTAYLESNA